MTPHLVIVSMHEKGFPTADFYFGLGAMPADEFEQLGAAPDMWFSMHKGDTLEAAKTKAAAKWPEAKIVVCEDDDEE